MSSAEQVVRDFCAAASTRNPAVLRAYFSHDVVYHNIPMAPAEGIDATMAVIEIRQKVMQDLAPRNDLCLRSTGSDGGNDLPCLLAHFGHAARFKFGDVQQSQLSKPGSTDNSVRN